MRTIDPGVQVDDLPSPLPPPSSGAGSADSGTSAGRLIRRRLHSRNVLQSRPTTAALLDGEQKQTTVGTCETCPAHKQVSRVFQIDFELVQPITRAPGGSRLDSVSDWTPMNPE